MHIRLRHVSSVTCHSHSLVDVSHALLIVDVRQARHRHEEQVRRSGDRRHGRGRGVECGEHSLLSQRIRVQLLSRYGRYTTYTTITTTTTTSATMGAATWGTGGYVPPPTLKSRGTSYVLVPILLSQHLF